MSEEPAPSGSAPAPAKPKRVLVKPLSVVLGMVSGLGFAVLLWQYSVTTLTWGVLFGMMLLGALVFGIGLPSLMLNIYLARGAQKEVPK